MKPSRRAFVQGALLASGGLGLRSLLTGLPPAFLARGAMAQGTTTPTFALVAVSGDGESWNCNGPGSYSSDPGHAISLYAEHPAAWSQPVSAIVGGQTHLVAPPWGDPLVADPAMLAELAIVNHPTQANAHPEFDSLVRTINRTVTDARGDSAMFLTMLAEELAEPLGALTHVPLPLGEDVPVVDGAPLAPLTPSQLAALFPPSTDLRKSIRQLRDLAIDRAYQEVKLNGSLEQQNYFDKYAISRDALRSLQEELAPYLVGIGKTPDGLARPSEEIDQDEDQVEAAIALLKLRMAPIVTIRLNMSADNHADADLDYELASTPKALAALSTLWSRLQVETDHYGAPLAEQVTFWTEDCFGRTLARNYLGGRDHNGQANATLAFGPRIQPGTFGGLAARFDGLGAFSHFESKPIDPLTGLPTRVGGIPTTETFASVAKTLATAVGLDAATIEARISAGQPIEGMLR